MKIYLVFCKDDRMLNRFIRPLALVIFTCSIAPFSLADDDINLQIISEENPPYNFTKDDEFQGLAVDLLAEMLKRITRKFGVSEIKIMPWEDGYRLLKEKPNVVLFSTTRTKGRENQFKWVCPIATDKAELVSLKSRGIKIDSKTDLLNYKIGTVRHSAGEQLLLDLGVSPQALDYTSYASLYKNLTNKNVDIIAFNLEVIQRLAQVAGMSPQNYESIYLLSESELCYAFNKSTSSTVVENFQKAMDEMIASGTHKKITTQYIQN